MVTRLWAFFSRFTMALHSRRSGWWVMRPSFRHTTSSRPSLAISRGTSYSVSAVAFWMTQSGWTLQNRAIFRRMSSVMGTSHRQTRMSGWMPRLSSSFTECWVGLLFSSPLPGIWTMRGTWMNTTSPRGRSAATCRMASRKGWDSISPTVPPISVMTTSTSSSAMA